MCCNDFFYISLQIPAQWNHQMKLPQPVKHLNSNYQLPRLEDNQLCNKGFIYIYKNPTGTNNQSNGTSVKPENEGNFNFTWKLPLNILKHCILSSQCLSSFPLSLLLYSFTKKFYQLLHVILFHIARVWGKHWDFLYQKY